MKKQIMLLALLLSRALTGLQAQTYPEMVTVQGGTFSMGDEYGIGLKSEYPLHNVTLKTFKIAKTETTVVQYRRFCEETGVKMPAPPSWGWNDNHPIVNISWHDAVAYCDWLSKKTGQLYRLPTEAEWEYAARGGKQSKGFMYAGGQNMVTTGWYDDNANQQTQPVAQKRPNELGIYDMSGNVLEWCSDFYVTDYYEDSPATNPTGPARGGWRVLRGGSWFNQDLSCRVARRGVGNPRLLLNHNGFRVVLSQ